MAQITSTGNNFGADPISFKTYYENGLLILNGRLTVDTQTPEFIAPQIPVTTAIALKSAYDNKYGAPSEGKPKVFVKYFYVNTATGEKSGDMLALAVLEADED